MAWYTAVFLGLVQGVAEFLPISSSGHLLVWEHWLGVTADRGFSIILHLATLAAVVVVYWRRLVGILRHPFSPDGRALILATAVSCGLVLVFKGVIDRLFTLSALPYLFMVAGVWLLVPGLVNPRPNPHGYRQAAVMGLAQGVAVVPGLSRSGLTMVAGELAGKTPPDAADFSFIMAVPIILASVVYELWSGGSFTTVPAGSLVWAFVAAFGAGLVAIKGMLQLVRTFRRGGFAFYLLGLGVILLLDVRFQVF